MSISDIDIKKLWGLSAGRCSKPGCNEECIKFLDASDPTVIGEMAHIIAKSEDGPRGEKGGGGNSYENIILLCPTHHREVDKAPAGIFTVELLHEWKVEHENGVKESLSGPRFQSQTSFALEIKRMLIENKMCWKQYGPESEEALRNPLSNMKVIWDFRKLNLIVPNNTRIIQMIKQNKEYINIQDYGIFVEFIEHAEGFERNCYFKTEGVPRFPISFEKVIDCYAGD